MTNEIEEGPDPNDVRRHAKKMCTEIEYRRRYRRIDYYKPNAKQRDFHNLLAVEKMLRAGNQQGKTHCCGAQMTMDVLGRYPDWYQGRRFETPPPIERPFDFLGWIASTTSTTTRDGAQTKLLGDIRQQDGLGTGMIPLDSIVARPIMARGISDFVDTVSVRRDSGGRAALRFKTFEMSRQAYQGESVDEVWLDEDPGDDVVYGETLARLTATRGQILFSATPVLGTTPVRKRFKQKLPGTAEILMTIDDADHIPPEERAAIIARYKESERATRVYGADMAGEGAVFVTPVDSIVHNRDPASFPGWWPWLWAVDFSHGGMSAEAHPFAAVLGCHDRDADVIYVVHALRMRQALPIQHVAALRSHPAFGAPVAWPHDGGMTGFGSTDTFAITYKKLGLNMLQSHATFKDGGYSFESGIAEMESRFATGRLQIASHLAEVLDEYRSYHRANNLVVKVDDDLMSAIRILTMQIRSAKVLARPGEPVGANFPRRQNGPPPPQDWDIFTGEALS